MLFAASVNIMVMKVFTYQSRVIVCSMMLRIRNMSVVIMVIDNHLLKKNTAFKLILILQLKLTVNLQYITVNHILFISLSLQIKYCH